MAEKEKPKLRVVKKDELENEAQAAEVIQGKPTPEEVEQYKVEFDQAMKDFTGSRWPVSDPGSFSANDVGMFLKEYLNKYVLWTKTGWMGVIKMNEELDKALKMDNEKTGLTFDYQTLEFCGYMLMNPGGIGYDLAAEFEKIADKYSKIMVEVGKKVEEARAALKDVQYLQDKWAAGVQGFYLADLEPKEEPKEEVTGDSSEKGTPDSE